MGRVGKGACWDLGQSDWKGGVVLPGTRKWGEDTELGLGSVRFEPPRSENAEQLGFGDGAPGEDQARHRAGDIHLVTTPGSQSHVISPDII